MGFIKIVKSRGRDDLIPVLNISSVDPRGKGQWTVSTENRRYFFRMSTEQWTEFLAEVNKIRQEMQFEPIVCRGLRVSDFTTIDNPDGSLMVASELLEFLQQVKIEHSHLQFIIEAKARKRRRESSDPPLFEKTSPEEIMLAEKRQRFEAILSENISKLMSRVHGRAAAPAPSTEQSSVEFKECRECLLDEMNRFNEISDRHDSMDSLNDAISKLPPPPPCEHGSKKKGADK